MAKELIKIDADSLIGPRSYFTDLATFDPNPDMRKIISNLKLQLLTKQVVIFAASALFHDVGFELFSNEKGLPESLEKGIIVPAIRDDFQDIESFYKGRHEGGYSDRSKEFFLQHISQYLPWNLNENSGWFKKKLYEALSDEKSLLRKRVNLNTSDSEHLESSIDTQIQQSPEGNRFLRIEHVVDCTGQLKEQDALAIVNYAKLVYRLSGSRVVNSDPHLPETQLLSIEGAEKYLNLADERIFWDIYIETVFSFLNKAVQLEPGRLDNLSFADILEIRNKLIKKDFIAEYERIVRKAKQGVDFSDPEGIISKQEEINSIVRKLKSLFEQRIRFELNIKYYKSRENALWQMTNALGQFTPVGPILGLISILQSIPEITTLFSRRTAKAIKDRYEYVRLLINSMRNLSENQKRSLLDGYIELAQYGLPKNS